MSSVVSLELVLDDAGDAAIRREWALLSEAGLPSQAHHTGATHRPHVTLLVRTSLPGYEGAAFDDRFPFGILLGAPVLFGTGRTRVLARSVVPSADLLALHADVHVRAGPGDDAPHTLPGEWTPHVTLARRLPVDRVGEALTTLAADSPPVLATEVVGIRRWDAATRTVSPVAGRGTLEPC